METKKCIQLLTEGRELSEDQASAAISEMMSGNASDAQIGAFLVALRMGSAIPRPGIISACAKSMLACASPIQINAEVVDVVGTGGDGLDTFNVSTAAGIVVAACGLPVAKHGNRSSSGNVGSADFLEALGARITLDGPATASIVEECGFAFLFAQMFHPAMKHVAPARKQVGVRTIFNLLGPLTNPAVPKFQVTGVSSMEVGAVFADLFVHQGTERAMIVHSVDGLDELSCAAPTHVWLVENGKITEMDVEPKTFGLTSHPLTAVQGQSAMQRAAVFRRVLAGEKTSEILPFRDYIIMNAAAVVFVAGAAPDLESAARRCEQAIDSGKATAVLDRYVALSNSVEIMKSSGTKRTADADTDRENHKKVKVDGRASILTTIAARRKHDVEEARNIVPLEVIKEKCYNVSAALLLDRVLKREDISVMAEIKRASPSRGMIDGNIDAPAQATKYAKGGAAVISVLTEPTWFKGTLQDMADVRKALDKLGDERPAVLRKDFIVDEYQIFEARANGADTILLIVAILTDIELKNFLAVSRGLGMEPLVEVNNELEHGRALACGARVIGVNNRNLHDFTVDLSTTDRVFAGTDRSIVLCALSGISTRQHVQRYRSLGVSAVLVGEALMRASDPIKKIRELRGLSTTCTLVKVCGIKNMSMALMATSAGADMIGLVFAPGSHRQISESTAKEIVQSITRGQGSAIKDMEFKNFAEALRTACGRRPLVVGVFADQDVKEVNRIAAAVDLDIIQLSGHENCSKEALSAFVRPVLKAFHVSSSAAIEDVLQSASECTAAGVGVLLDTKHPTLLGGSGMTFDWKIAEQIQQKAGPLFLAGGLNPENVADAISQVHPLAVDVSSGVETNKVKDPEKVKAFLAAVKNI